MKKYRGTVKWFNDRKGYGFLAREDREEDQGDGDGVFVHCDTIEGVDGVKKTLVKGQIVDFYVVKSEKGLKAIQVNFVEVEEE